MELFVFAGSFLEELLSPIPAFIVLLPAGVVAAAQNQPLWYLVVIALVAGAGKLPAAAILYWLAKLFRTKAVGKRDQIFGVTQTQIRRASKQFGNTKKGWWTLFAMHAVPVFPGTLLSLAAGFITMNVKYFVLATFLGAFVNAVLHLLIGYLGLKAIGWLQTAELASQIITILILGLIVLLLVRNQLRRHRRRNA